MASAWRLLLAQAIRHLATINRLIVQMSLTHQCSCQVVLSVFLGLPELGGIEVYPAYLVPLASQ